MQSDELHKGNCNEPGMIHLQRQGLKNMNCNPGVSPCHGNSNSSWVIEFLTDLNGTGYLILALGCVKKTFSKNVYMGNFFLFASF